jgi:hypothetical protein
MTGSFACETSVSHSSFEELPSAEIVLFTPADVAPPAEAIQSLQNLGLRTEAFFAKWLQHWGYPARRQSLFSRGESGSILIREVAGDKPLSSGAYNNWQSLAERRLPPRICDETVRKYSIPRNGNYFWIFVWLGPEQQFKDWRGSGGPRKGGHCVVRYPNDGDFTRAKTHIHEFGHALGLPHIGPRMQDAPFCSLMGPNELRYCKVMGRNYDDFCLTPAEAAMLWRHPVFSGTVQNRERFPRQIALANYGAKFDRYANAIIVTGTLHTDLACHSVVVVDHPDGVSDYWRKGYISRLGGDGSFSVRVNEPADTSGRLMILPCFENGINTGNGKKHGLRTAFQKGYERIDDTFAFGD